MTKKYNVHSIPLMYGVTSLWMMKTKRVVGVVVLIDEDSNPRDIKLDAFQSGSEVRISAKDVGPSMKSVPSLGIITVEDANGILGASENRNFKIGANDDMIGSEWVLIGIVSHDRMIYYVFEQINEASVGL
jgi:hypothetical protein